jgi:hypothetical protein
MQSFEWPGDRLTVWPIGKGRASPNTFMCDEFNKWDFSVFIIVSTVIWGHYTHWRHKSTRTASSSSQRNWPITEMQLIMVFWFVMPCSLSGGYQYFGGTYCLHLQGEVSKDWDVRHLYRQRSANGNGEKMMRGGSHKGHEQCNCYAGFLLLFFILSPYL